MNFRIKFAIKTIFFNILKINDNFKTQFPMRNFHYFDGVNKKKI